MKTLKTVLFKPTNFLIALGSAFLIFDISFYAMKTLPGTINKTCAIGANFNMQNLIFAGIFSILMGVIIVGLITLVKHKQAKRKNKIASLTGLAAILSGGTMFCSLCTLPILATLGLASFLYFFLEYSLIFQIISLILVIFSLYLIDQQLADNCKLGCKI